MTEIGRPEIGETMEYELCGNVYRRDQFFKGFLELGPLTQEDVGQWIRSSTDFEQMSLFGYANGRWTIGPEITEQTNEKEVYAPLARMLNAIGRAAYAKYMELFPNHDFRQSYQPFRNYHNHHAPWDSPSGTYTSPDPITAPERARTHWADMELLIECKTHSDQTSRNKAYLQLARYARATFAHQIYWLRVLGFSPRGSTVNFVCFDRSGLLRSPNLDLPNLEHAVSSVKYTIDLLTLRHEMFGYDARFSFRWEAGQSVVHTLFKFGDHEPPTLADTGTSGEPTVPGSTPAATPVVLIKRPAKIKSGILMPRGRLLFDAQNSLHLLMAIHDALLGTMALTEAGKVNCDISAYNLLLIYPITHHGNKGRLNAPKSVLKPARWDYNGTGTRYAAVDDCSSIPASTSECPRLEQGQRRGPVCIIHDTEFMINEGRDEVDVHSDQVGTPAFISAQLLESYMSQGKITRTYVHDAESLLWVLIWVVAHRSMHEDRWEAGAALAADIIQQLSTHNIKSLWWNKRAMLSNRRRLVSDIQKMGTELSKDLAHIIGELAEFFFLYLYVMPPDPRSGLGLPHIGRRSKLGQVEDALHKQYVEESRGQTFNRLFEIIDTHITGLQEMYPTPN